MFTLVPFSSLRKIMVRPKLIPSNYLSVHNSPAFVHLAIRNRERFVKLNNNHNSPSVLQQHFEAWHITMELLFVSFDSLFVYGCNLHGHWRRYFTGNAWKFVCDLISNTYDLQSLLNVTCKKTTVRLVKLIMSPVYAALNHIANVAVENMGILPGFRNLEFKFLS
jgi:hypothetical protein